MKYDDLMQFKNEQTVKQEGKYYQKGKDYIVEDGDIIFFRFNVGKGKTEKWPISEENDGRDGCKL